MPEMRSSADGPKAREWEDTLTTAELEQMVRGTQPDPEAALTRLAQARFKLHHFTQVFGDHPTQAKLIVTRVALVEELQNAVAVAVELEAI